MKKGLIDQSSKWIKNVGDAYAKMREAEESERRSVTNNSDDNSEIEEGAVLPDIKKKAKISAKLDGETETSAKEVPKPSHKRSLRPNRERRPQGAE